MRFRNRIAGFAACAVVAAAFGAPPAAAQENPQVALAGRLMARTLDETAGRVQKWTAPPTVNLVGDATAFDVELTHRAARAVGVDAGLALPEVRDAPLAAGQIVVVYGLDLAAEMAARPELAALLELPPEEDWRRNPRVGCVGLMGRKRNDAPTMGFVFARVDRDADARRKCVARSFLNALGVVPRGFDFPGSVQNDGAAPTWFSPADRAVLAVLYRPNLKPGPATPATRQGLIQLAEAEAARIVGAAARIEALWAEAQELDKQATAETKRLSNDQILANFAHVVFGRENGPPVAFVQKIVEPIRITATGEASEPYIGFIEWHMNRLNGWMGAPLLQGADGGLATGSMFIDPDPTASFPPQLQAMFDENFGGVALDEALPDWAARRSCVTLLHSGGRDGDVEIPQSHLTGFTVLLNRKRGDPIDRNALACIVEELTQATGLMNDGDHVAPSIFNDASDYAEITDHDVLLLRVLYDPRIEPGMPKAEALEVARRILREINPGGETTP